MNKYLSICLNAKSLQLCLTLCDPMGCSLPGSPVHGILQARILKWVAMPSSKGNFLTQGQPWASSCPALAGTFFTTSATQVYVWPKNLFRCSLPSYGKTQVNFLTNPIYTDIHIQMHRFLLWNQNLQMTDILLK